MVNCYKYNVIREVDKSLVIVIVIVIHKKTEYIYKNV